MQYEKRIVFCVVGFCNGFPVFPNFNPGTGTGKSYEMKPILDGYVKMTKAKGLPGDEALKFIQDYLKTHQ